MTINGNGKPTKQTKADVNDIYVDLETDLQYRCSMIVMIGFDIEYWWEPEPTCVLNHTSSYEDFVESYRELDTRNNKTKKKRR